MNASEIASRLREIVRPDAVREGERILKGYAHDWSPARLIELRAGARPRLPLCAVAPGSTQEVADVLRWCNAEAIAVVPFGAGSSVVEGIEPEGAVVVDLRAMDRIRDLDTKSRLVEVEAGVMGPDLASALAAEGWMTGHEPQSIALSTVGGWVATRACGQLSSGYGGIEDMIAGLEAVLPSGEIVSSSVVPRRSAGPDIASLMIGSEGTLGIVTSVTLRVSPIIEERADRCVRFEKMAEGVAAARSIAQSDLTPTVLRLYDAEDAMLFLRHHPDEPQGPLMIMSFHGPGAERDATRAVELAGGIPGETGLVSHWWEHRNDAALEFRRVMSGEGLLGPHGVIDTIEVSGTWTVLRELYHSIKDGLADVTDLVACHLSHIYVDGACLYFTCAAVTDSDEEATARLDSWWEVAMANCLAAGGSISHHHGIGRRKAPWLGRELDGWFGVLKAVKAAIDPKGIMNPGALGL